MSSVVRKVLRMGMVSTVGENSLFLMCWVNSRDLMANLTIPQLRSQKEVLH